MTFAIPVTDPTAIRCKAIIDRLVSYRPGSAQFDEGWRHGSEWLARAEGLGHPHPFIAFDGDAVIRALVETPDHKTWLEKGREWVAEFERANRTQHRHTMMLPVCRDLSDLVAANID